MPDKIVIRGARQHNLKNIDLEIPRDKMVVITGISGSGKSSLAFDTIYAEEIAYTPIPYNLDALTSELHEIEVEIGDEHSQIPVHRMPRPQSVTVLLTYPHQRAGTLPLSPQLKMMFPTAYEAPRIRFTLVDPETDTELPGDRKSTRLNSS